MNTTSFGIAMHRFVAIAFILVLAPIARGPVANSVIVADQATSKQAITSIVLAQGRCFNGKCF